MRLLNITRDMVKPQLVGLIPVGSVEQHGPHLPMGTDSIIAEYIASKAEERLKDKVLLFPTIYFGVSIEHKGYPFVSLSFQSAILMWEDILESIVQNLGLKRIVIVNGHGGNTYYLPLVQREFNMKHKDEKVVIFNTWDEGDKSLFNVNDMHAGSIETSRIYYINKELVQIERIRDIDDYSVKDGVFTYLGTKEANKWGVINEGKPIVIDEEKGKISIENAVNRLISLIQSLN
ncbi:MAG: creatininase family protein [Sulfolobus sp.]|nr:creatininase family protein [Sulfolobus sp.]